MSTFRLSPHSLISSYVPVNSSDGSDDVFDDHFDGIVRVDDDFTYYICILHSASFYISIFYNIV